MSISSTLWNIEPHSTAKHEILHRYLGAWFGIMGVKNPNIIYLDGFCGPGRYLGGEEGSPIIALKIALDHFDKGKIQETTFVFVDDRKDRVKFLENEIMRLQIPKSFFIDIQHNEFDTTLTNILDNLELKGLNNVPTFAFIDPFGFKGTPFHLVERLLNNKKTEVFINIMIDAINRFIDHPDPHITQHIVDLFGTVEVKRIIKYSGDRITKMRKLYQDQLLKCAKFVRYFEMRDENNRIIYYLFFATNNRLGHVKMKEAFWKIDKSLGLFFSDATNPNQLVLFIDDPSKEIIHCLLRKYKGKRLTVQYIREYIEDDTPYIKSQLKKALKLLEEQQKIFVEPIKQNGNKRIKNTFPDEVIIEFI